MPRIRFAATTILLLGLWAGAVPAQTAGGTPPPGPPFVVASGGYRLTEAMLGDVLRFGQILAAADFSPTDAAALRSDLIAYFQKEPAKQIAAYQSVAQVLRRLGRPSWLTLALLRYGQWQSYGDAQRFRRFQSYPFGRMVLKYNPVLVSSGGMVVTGNDVDCLFYSNAMVAKAAGVAGPAPADKNRFVENLPSHFASMPAGLKEDLRQAEIRLARFAMVYDGTVKTRAAVLADIRKNVHASADVWREARQVESDAGSAGEKLTADQERAAAFQSRLAVMQMQFQMKLDAAKAAKDAARALGNRADAGAARQARQTDAGTGAAGKYWRSYVAETAAAAANGAGVDDGIGSLDGLIKRDAHARQEPAR
jgi:hypothetical protein